MDNLNLNIDTYSDRELERLFSLESNYTRENVIKGKKVLQFQLQQQQGNLGPELRRQIEMFIDTATHKLAIIADNTTSDSDKGTWAMKHAPLLEGSANNFVIENPNALAGRNAKIADGRMGGTDETPPGWLNPINIRTLLVGMNIDSRFRPNYYSSNASDFTVQLPDVMKKITNMRIATVEIPMTYYGISRSRGNATMVITSALTLPVEINSDGTFGGALENGQKVNHPATCTVDGTRLQFSTNTNVIQVDNPQTPAGLLPGNLVTMGQVLLSVDNTPAVHSNTFTTQSFIHSGTTQGQYSGTLGAFNPTPDENVLGAQIELGWLVILPDGNYEMDWQSGNNSADITVSMNNALSCAYPGFLDTRSGEFWCFAQPSPTSDPNMLAYIPYLDYGIRSKYDLCYNVDRRNGRSIFCIPTGGKSPTDIEGVPDMNVVTRGNGAGNWTYLFSDPSNYTDPYTAPAYPGNALPIPGAFARTGFMLHFPTSPGGSLQFDENIQLFLGWQLGFRAGHYKCDKEISAVSEGICLPCGPRYMFLSIDDGLKSSGSNFIAAFAESTLDENVMTRINLSNTLDDVGVYKCASDVGLSNQLNRTREYFGPVDVSRLRCRLLDEYGRIIDLNNMDWSMSIVFEKLYD